MMVFFRDVLPGSSKKIPPFYIPGEHAVMIAKAAKTLGLGGLLPFDAGQAMMGQEDSFAAMDKAREHLGITPRPFRETVRQYAARV
jgi:hypothetical protein